MSIAPSADATVLWFLPTHGDARHLGTAIGGRPVNLHYLRQIAQSADHLGYFGVLLPTGRSCEVVRDLPRPHERGSPDVAALEGRILCALFRKASAGE